MQGDPAQGDPAQGDPAQGDPAHPPGRCPVLILTQGFPRAEGDHRAPFVLDHARALASSGVPVRVLCPSGPGLARRACIGGIEVRRFRYAPRRLEVLAYSGAMHRDVRGPKALLVPLFLAGFLVGALREGRSAGVLHAHWWAPSGLVAVVAGRLLGIPAVVHVHGTDAAIARGPLRRLARWVLRSAGAVLAASADLAAWVRSVAGVHAAVVPMPLGLDRLPPPTPAPGDGPVLAVARLVPEKGIDVLVQAAAAAGVTVEVVGEGERRAELEDLARTVGADVRFLGALAPEALAERYARARLVAVPSRREGFGLVAAEAAAAGRAVVASRVGGLVDIVVDGVNGALVPPGDVGALAAALRSTDPALGANGPASVAHLAPGAIVGATLPVYDQAAARVRPALGPRLVRVAAGAAGLAAAVLAVRAVVAQWGEASRLQLRWAAGPVAAAAVGVLGADLVMSGAWWWLARRGGAVGSWRRGLRIWWTGQLGRYLPTGLGSLPARVMVGARWGVSRRLLVLTSAAEVAAVVVANAAVAPLVLPGAWRWLALGAAAVGAALLGPLTELAGSRLAPHQRLAGAEATAFLAAHVGVAVGRGIGLWALLHVVADVLPSPVLVVGALGLANAAGTVAVFAPGGVGVREAVLVALLAGSVGAPQAAAAAVAWRLLELVAEAALIAVTRLLRPA